MSDFSLEGFLHAGCGGKYRRITETAPITISGMRVSIEREVFRCSLCSDARRTFDQLEVAERTARETVRAIFALLGPKEITAIRTALGLELKPFSALIPVTEGVVRGWEKGTYVQNQAADAVLRRLASDPAFVTAAAARAGITLPVVVAGPRTAGGVIEIPAGSPVDRPVCPTTGAHTAGPADASAPERLPSLSVPRPVATRKAAASARDAAPTDGGLAPPSGAADPLE